MGRDISGRNTEHTQKVISFSGTGDYLGGLPFTVPYKTITMAKLSGPLGFKGKLSDISAYTRIGCEGTILRMGWGPSKEDIQTKDCYRITRKYNAEFGGCSTTSGFIMKVISPLKPVVNYNISAVLTGLLKQIQQEDRESKLGKRNVLISKKRFLLEGLNLNQRHSFENVISTPLPFELDKEAGTVRIEIPELTPGANFFPPSNFSVCRIKALLGIVPDFYYALPRYKPLKKYKDWMPAVAQSEWFQAANGCSSIKLELTVPHNVSEDGFSLLLAVGLEVGRPLVTGEMVPLLHNGCGKILAVR